MYNRNYIALYILLGFLSIFFFRCGAYSFSGSTLPAHIKTVHIPLFEDQTAEFGIDQQITDGIIEALIKDNTIKIGGRNQADALLLGQIVRVTERAGQYSDTEQASDFRLNITLKASFEDVKKRNVIWEEEWTEFGTFTSSGDRSDAIAEAAEKLAENIVNRTVSGW